MVFVIHQLELLYGLIPLAIILFILLRKKYIKDDLRLVKSKGRKRFIFFSKLIFFMFLLLALSSPYLEYTETASNITKIKVLIDNSDSMQLYDLNDAENKLSTVNLPLEIQKLDLGDYTTLGNSILNHLSPEENILLVTDGQNNFGTDLDDVALFASTINSKIYALELDQDNDDANIVIEGPGKVVADVENTFTVIVNEVGQIGKKKVKVYIDDFLIFDDKYEKEIELKRSFNTETVIKAELETNDHFEQNNIFYKTVSVHKQPKVLFVSRKNSELFNLYKDFYAMDFSDDLDKDLDKYHAVILNDVNSKYLSDDDVDKLDTFLNEENGLFVIGGKDSYDWGEYNTSMIANLLPVSVGKAKKKKDIVNIAIVMDTGASSKDEIKGNITFFDVQKSLAVDIINSISGQNKVSFIEANYYLNTLSGLSELEPKRTDLIGDISLLFPHGFSEVRFAYEKAHKSLRLTKGSKNIIIITDGKLVPQDQAMTLEIVKKARSDGIKTFIVGVGDAADDEFLKSVKEFGDGEYFRTDETYKLKLYFGDPSENTGELSVFVYDSNHFITTDLEDLSRIYGFNTVFPKTNARLLLTTSKGDPVLTTWNYGLGRVAALTTDDGSTWIPGMLNNVNSKAFIRTLNWLVENPERKNNLIIEHPELRIGENSVITVKSDNLPSDEFYETEKGIYKSNLYPNETGVQQILNKKVGVNYKKEYLNIGFNNKLENALRITGGDIIKEITPEKLLSLTQVETVKTKDLSWVFIMLSIIAYLIEILVRRIQDLKVTRT